MDKSEDKSSGSEEEDGGRTLYEGDRVRRGPDWEWGSQDGLNADGTPPATEGAATSSPTPSAAALTGIGTGVVIMDADSDPDSSSSSSPSVHGWVKVRWDHDHSTNSYRDGADGKHDLIKIIITTTPSNNNNSNHRNTNNHPQQQASMMIKRHMKDAVLEAYHRHKLWKLIPSIDCHNNDTTAVIQCSHCATSSPPTTTAATWVCVHQKNVAVCASGYALCDPCMAQGLAIQKRADALIEEVAKTPEGVMTRVHDHPLIYNTRDNGWRCDGVKAISGGCKRGITGFNQTKAMRRWRCDRCDFDLCDLCLVSCMKSCRLEGPVINPVLDPGHLVGRRVKRGYSWQWDDQDGGAGSEGTVLSFIPPSSSGGVWVRVQWDKTRTNSYCWGVNGKWDLTVVNGEREKDEEEHDVNVDGIVNETKQRPGRIVAFADTQRTIAVVDWTDTCSCNLYLLPQLIKHPPSQPDLSTKQLTTPQTIKQQSSPPQQQPIPQQPQQAESTTTTTTVEVKKPPWMRWTIGQLYGRKVRRGKDWKWGEQGGNSIGVCFDKPTSDGWVYVKWENKEENCYRWNCDGCWDLEPADFCENWSFSNHHRCPPRLQKVAMTVMCCGHREESPLSVLPRWVLHNILENFTVQDFVSNNEPTDLTNNAAPDLLPTQPHVEVESNSK